MGKTVPWSTAEIGRLRKLHAEGKGCAEIGRILKRSSGSVSTHAKKLGLKFDRSQVEAAVQASIIDRKALRAQIIEKLLTRANHNLDRLNAEEFETLVKSGPGEESPDVLEFVPTVDEKNLTASINLALTSAAKLEALDDDGGATEARGLMGTFLAAIHAAAEPEEV